MGCTANNVTGSNLIECDQNVLKEMGIKKIGDRVRIIVGIKQLRLKAVGNLKKRNRDSIAALENHPIYTPSSSTGSPRNYNASRDRPYPTPPTNHRFSTQIDPSASENFTSSANARPSSPLAESQKKGLRAQRYVNMSPIENSRKDQGPGYFSNPSSAKTVSGVRPGTPSNSNGQNSGQIRQNPNADTTLSRLPTDIPCIRVIYNSGQTKTLDIRKAKTAEEITAFVVKSLRIRDDHPRNYCFYVLEHMSMEPTGCRRLTDAQLVQICSDLSRKERHRLILRKINSGEPDEEERQKAAALLAEESYETYDTALANNKQNADKLQKLTGETWEALKYPLSPATFNMPQGALDRQDRHRSRGHSLVHRPERTDSRRAPKPKIQQFVGQRPPSELISQELTTYFPDHHKEEIEKTVRMSVRRSARLSRAASRISIASNASFTSSLKDAPPLPSIADTWLTGLPNTARGPRPLSVSKFALPQTSFRDSIASSSLQPLQEESPTEPDRKSYVSFDSNSELANINVPDDSASQTYYNENGSSGANTDAGGSLTEHLSTAIAEDGEGPDEELDSFLKGDSWDNVKWMQGSLIGQGSFGSVFLALHAITGELMAVKQVDLPSTTNEMEKRKKVMLDALKHEIDLLRTLQHPHIVQYLGSNSDDEHLNIFLEYVPGGSIAAMLVQYGTMKEPLIRSFCGQILQGLAYLHSKQIIHRDIKGANVLVDNRGTIKISDFGISKRVEASALLHPKTGGHVHRPSLQGSIFWMAPEVVKQTHYSLKADIWSLGCLIVEMFTGSHPFPDYSQLQAIFQIGTTSAKPATPEGLSPDGKDFLRQTFEIDESMRPTADQLLLTPFLKRTA